MFLFLLTLDNSNDKIRLCYFYIPQFLIAPGRITNTEKEKAKMEKISFDETKYLKPTQAPYVNRLAPPRIVKLVLREGVTQRQRQILLLYFYERKNMAEIAEILGINKSTVSRTMKRGLRHLRQYLQFYAEQKKDDE